MRIVTVIACMSLLLLAACRPSGLSTGGNSSATPVPEGAKRVTLNKEFTVNGLKVVIGDVQVQKDKILIGMTTNNTSKDKLTFFPNQGKVLFGNMQLDANMFMGEGDVSGDIESGIEKNGVVTFTVPNSKFLIPEEVKKIELRFGSVMNHRSYKSQEFSQSVAL